jgi:NADH:ubiquinone oxidoreductase subunit 2 (subunit N)
LLTYCGFMSLVFGSLGGLQQNKIKRLVIYSSLGNVGILLLLLAINTTESLASFFLFLLLYVSTNLSLFCFLLSFVTNSPLHRLLYITDLIALRRQQPLSSAFFALLLFSMAGLPPFGGFFGKYVSLISVFSSSSYVYVPVLLLASLVSSFYYVRLVKIIFFDTQATQCIVFLQSAFS